LTAESASLPVGARRIAAAVATLAVLTAVTTGSDSLAQSPNLSTPSVSLGAGGVRVDSRALSLVPTAPVSPPAQAPSAPALPSVPKLPSAPALPPPPTLPSAPTAPATPVEPPSLPRIDIGDSARDPAGAVDEASGEPVGESLRLPGALDPNTVSRSGAAALQPTSGSSAGASTPGQAGLIAATTLPSRSELAKLPPAERRKLIRRAFDEPLSERRLRQLRMTIRRYSGCLRALPYRGRNVLQLRAGLLGGDPASRRAIGRRIGASPRAVAGLERSSLRRLIDAGERGLCVGGSAATAFGGPAGGSGALVGMSSGDDQGGGTNRVSPTGEVLADVHGGGPGIDLGDGEEGPAETLLFFLLALLAVLGPLAAIAIASRRRAAHGAALGRAAGERPLLFLDVDGVLVLDALLAGIPSDWTRVSSLGLSYIPDRTEALVCKLATRFDLVWATGWEHRANTTLLRPLGLSEDLPVLTFGNKARFGSSKWKIKPVKAYAGNRPAAWLDDNFVASHERWAAHRYAPTLLVPVDSRVGLTADHVERLLQWADRLAPSRVAEPAANERRLRAG
jgi:hypothetical protein